MVKQFVIFHFNRFPKVYSFVELLRFVVSDWPIFGLFHGWSRTWMVLCNMPLRCCPKGTPVMAAWFLPWAPVVEISHENVEFQRLNVGFLVIWIPGPRAKMNQQTFWMAVRLPTKSAFQIECLDEVVACRFQEKGLSLKTQVLWFGFHTIIQLSWARTQPGHSTRCKSSYITASVFLGRLFVTPILHRRMSCAGDSLRDKHFSER